MPRGCIAPSLSSGGWSQVFSTCSPNHAFIHSSFGALAVGLECSTHASIVLPAQPFPPLCRSAGRVQHLSWSFPEPGPHSACLLSSKSFPSGKHRDGIVINFFFFDLETFSVLKGKSLAESLTRCINHTEDAQRKSSQNLSECCRKAYFLVNLFLEVTELFWLKFTV